MSFSGRSGQSVRKSADRRISRTRRTIDQAFLGLLMRRGYDAVGVSDIVREADGGRATFYEHYTSKDDLLSAQLRRVCESVLNVRLGEAGFIDASALFTHVRDVPVLYRLVAGRSASSRSLKVFHEAIEERAAAQLLERVAAGTPLREPLTPGVAARVVAADLGALLSWWTEHGMKAGIDEMQSLFGLCIS